MADLEQKTSAAQDFELENDIFETNFCTMIGWSQEKWLEEQHSADLYQNSINSLRYASKKLKPLRDDHRLMLATFENGELKITSDRQWITVLKDAGVWDGFRGFFYVRNPRITGIQVANLEVKDKILSLIKMVGGGRIIDIEWFYDYKVHMRVHWVPENFYEKELKEEIQKYVEIESFERIKRTEDEETFQTNTINVIGIQRKGNQIEEIPHLIDFKGIEVLYVVRGRAPLCLNCEQIGHKAKECILRFCKKCKKKVVKEHTCREADDSRTYAAAVKKNQVNHGILSYEQENWPKTQDFYENMQERKGGGGYDQDEKRQRSELENGKDVGSLKDPQLMDIDKVNLKRNRSDADAEIETKSLRQFKTYMNTQPVAVKTANTFDVLVDENSSVFSD